jgi:hypothetical protein
MMRENERGKLCYVVAAQAAKSLSHELGVYRIKNK